LTSTCSPRQKCEISMKTFSRSALTGSACLPPWRLRQKGQGDDTLANPSPEQLKAFSSTTPDEEQARRWHGDATLRHVYRIGESRNSDGPVTWGASRARLRHSPRTPGSRSAGRRGTPDPDRIRLLRRLGEVLVKKIPVNRHRENHFARFPHRTCGRQSTHLLSVCLTCALRATSGEPTRQAKEGGDAL
jgi:hypothetical protein